MPCSKDIHGVACIIHIIVNQVRIQDDLASPLALLHRLANPRVAANFHGTIKQLIANAAGNIPIRLDRQIINDFLQIRDEEIA